MTNEMVLQRTSNLVMPTHYMELDKEEMSYVEGGGIISYNIEIYLCESTLKSIMTGLVSAIASSVTSLICSYCGPIGAVLSPFVSTLVGIVAGIIADKIQQNSDWAAGGLRCQLTAFALWIPFVTSKSIVIQSYSL